MKKENKVWFRFAYLFFTLLIILSEIYVVNFFVLKQKAKQESNLLNTIQIEEYEVPKNQIEKIVQKTVGEIIKKKKERILKVKKLQEENADIVGWLEIEGTDINYPVLQGKDDEYYMTHNYKKEYSRNGSIFLSKDYNWDIPSNNLLIYGHNLNNGTMFQELLKYKDEEFYKEHQIIRFTTAFEDVEFEIISVFQSRVYYKSEKNVFRYYYFVNPETEEEYNEFVESAKRVSLYEIEATANYGDSLITLSTCSYHVKDGRFAVVGKKINKEKAKKNDFEIDVIDTRLNL